MNMKVSMRSFPVLLVLIVLSAALSSFPAFAASEGHFDRTLTVTGAVDLALQTGSGEISVRTGDSTKVEIHAKIHGSGWGGVEQRFHQIENNPPIEHGGKP